MSVLAASEAAPRRGPGVGTLAWAVTAVAVVALAAAEDLPKWARDYPRGWNVPLKNWITDAMKWLVNDATFGIFTFKEFTRSIAWVLDWFLSAAYGFLATGFDISEAGNGSLIIPRISWIALIAVVTFLAWKVKDGKLAILVGLCFAYLAVFGQWDSAMVTLASIVIAVPLGACLGLLLGIAAYRRPWLQRAITPVLDLMQTVPVFAYLVPILFLFGFGPVAAMIATMIYAMPPMVRITMLALGQVPDEIREYGTMAGCSRRQHVWKVMVPAAKPGLMVGLNQVIMLSLNMVIIASMIGAGGLGFDVLHALRRLAIGEGLEAGIAITLLAIALDRLSQAFAIKPPPHHDETRPAGFVRRHPYLLIGLILVFGSMALGAVLPFVESYPKALTLTTGTFFDHLVEWINVNLFDSIEIVKTWLVVNVMVPVKRFLLAVPWPVFVIVIAMAGWQLGGWRLALTVACFAAFILVTGNWEKAMISVYLCGLSVVIACLIGFPLGVWASGNPRVNRAVQVVIDTLQTLPSFVYLIPVVMLFQVGDFSAMIAIVAYAVAPATRYTIHGLSQVPDHLIEAARAQGCSRGQILRKVKLPLALPEIMLGVNQTIMMALSMLVITALVGTRDLGQEVYIALTKADTGRGIVAGVCVAFIAMIADRLISAWSTRRKKELGLA
jgi:glycine betaine/proline transport system permease protein